MVMPYSLPKGYLKIMVKNEVIYFVDKEIIDFFVCSGALV